MEATSTVAAARVTEAPPVEQSEEVATDVASEAPHSVHLLCGPTPPPIYDVDHLGFLRWGDGGESILFYQDTTVLLLEVSTGRLRTLADEPWSTVGVHADVLVRPPEGRTRDIVLATCEFPTGEPWDLEWLAYEPVLYRWSAHNYEIARFAADGRLERLTQGPGIEHFPVWSPDGQRIAYLRRSGRGSDDGWGVFTMAVDGSDSRGVVGPRPLARPPVWSPDGQALAYVSASGGEQVSLIVAPVSAVDGADLRRWEEVATGLDIGPVAWSPDGQHLAFGVVSSDMTSGLHVSAPDGSEVRLLYAGPEVARTRYKGTAWPTYRVSWSPDGEEILFAVGYRFLNYRDVPNVIHPASIYTTRPDGSGLREIDFGAYGSDDLAVYGVTWSPDGAEIAVHGSSDGRTLEDGTVVDKGHFLMVLPRRAFNSQAEGVRILARSIPTHDTYNPWRFAATASQPLPPLEASLCSGGVAVPSPDEHPELVADCEVLVAARDALAGDAMLLWGEGPISEWEGVTVGGAPLGYKKSTFVA